jgi:ribosomal protein L37AE/L43A
MIEISINNPICCELCKYEPTNRLGIKAKRAVACDECVYSFGGFSLESLLSLNGDEDIEKSIESLLNALT